MAGYSSWLADLDHIIFHGRVDSFISRMHSIQGDRCFSRWKGSVLDSVIGVFLTQNVTDHLSSSANMSLAARFPIKSRGGSESQKEEKVSSAIASEDAIGEHGKLSGQGSGAPSYVVVHESEQVDLKEMANHKESIESNTHIGHVSHEIGSATAVNIMSSTNGVEDENRRSLEINFVSSPNTVVVSQNSSEYPGQEDDQVKRNALFSIDDDDDLISRGIGNPSTNSFMELWKLASKLQEMNSLHKGSNGGIPCEKKVKAETEEKSTRHWDSLRKQAFCNGAEKERSSGTMDSMDYEALRNADVNVISRTIIEREMNNLLAARMKGLLNRLVEDHGSTDMEWLRDVPPDQRLSLKHTESRT